MSRKRENLDDDFSASSDDDAPEEIGMSAGKKQSLSQAQRFREQEKISKKLEKEKRRKRNEMFKLQKEKKLENISKRAMALPSGVLEAVAIKSAKTSEGEDMPESGFDLTEDANSDGEGPEDRLSDSGVDDDSNVNEDDYIPLNSLKHGSLNVVTVQNFTSKKKSATEAALDFRNSHLFGSQSAPRETAKQRQAKKLKKRFKCK